MSSLADALRKANLVTEDEAREAEKRRVVREEGQARENLRFANRGVSMITLLDQGASIGEIRDYTYEALVGEPNKVFPILKALHSLPRDDQRRRRLVPFFLTLREQLKGNWKLHERTPIIEQAYVDAGATFDEVAD